MIRVPDIMRLGKGNTVVAENHFKLSAEQTRISLAPAWAWRLIVCGALLEAISTLLPWGVDWLYLPWSLIVGGGAPLPASEFLTVSVLAKTATLVGWIGLVLYEYAESRMLPYAAILASSTLCFLAVAIFATTETGLSWGAYLSLVGGVSMMLGVVLEKLDVEIVAQFEESREKKGG